MSHLRGQAGKSTRDMASKRRKSALWIGLVGIAAVFIVVLFLLNFQTLGIGSTGILVLLMLTRLIPDFIDERMDGKLKEEKRAIRGAEAEEEIGELLADLSEDDYYVLDDIESPYGNIDHIVIGKNNGIFLIETKAHGGKVEGDGETILVNGELPEKNFIAQALRNTYWLRDEISQIVGSKPWITPIIVFTNAFVSPMRPIKGVSVINQRYLLNILQRANRSNAINAKIWEQRENIEETLM